MKFSKLRYVGYFLVLVLFIVLSPQVGSQTVVTWNLQWYPGRTSDKPKAEEEQKQIQACKAALEKLNPDIFIAQEMRDWQAFKDLVSVVPGLQVNVVSSFRDPITGAITKQQIGIASKLKVWASWSEAWQPVLPQIPRGYAFAALKNPKDDSLLMVYGLHLKSNRGSTEEILKQDACLRDESIKQLLTHMNAMQKVFKDNKIKGWISAGDHNTGQDGKFTDSVVATMEKAGFWNSWKETPEAERLTWRGNRFRKLKPTTFDYIFLKGLGKPKALMLEESPETSDHWPVMVRLPQ